MVAKFQETVSMANVHKDHNGQHHLVTIFRFYGNALRNHSENQHAISHKKTGIWGTSVLRILHDDLNIFPYKIQILQRQINHNKAKQKYFCEDISQRIENDSDLIFFSDEAHCYLSRHITKQNMRLLA